MQPTATAACSGSFYFIEIQTLLYTIITIYKQIFILFDARKHLKAILHEIMKIGRKTKILYVILNNNNFFYSRSNFLSGFLCFTNRDSLHLLYFYCLND